MQFSADTPFFQELGAEILEAQQGRAALALILERRHLNNWDVAHGGVVMTLLDIVMSRAGRSMMTEARAGVTVDMSVSFMQPAGREGERVIAKGAVVHQSTTLVFCESHLWNGEKLVARATGTFKYLRRAEAVTKLGSPL